MEKLDDSMLAYACSILADTNKGLSGSDIIKYSSMFSVRFNRPIPHTDYPFIPRTLPKSCVLKENINSFPLDEQIQIINFIVSLDKFIDSDEAKNIISFICSRYKDAEAIIYVSKIWPNVEETFNILRHGADSVSSLEGSREIISIFKDWVENNGGWKDIRDAGSRIRENVVRRMILLGAKKYLSDQNLDFNCDNNIGVGEEDIKISRGNDKTVIEIKLSSNPKCKNGFEKQILRYSEAEHTTNMIFVLFNLDNEKSVNEIISLYNEKRSNGILVPELIIIDSTQKESASNL